MQAGERGNCVASTICTWSPSCQKRHLPGETSNAGQALRHAHLCELRGQLCGRSAGQRVRMRVVDGAQVVAGAVELRAQADGLPELLH